MVDGSCKTRRLRTTPRTDRADAASTVDAETVFDGAILGKYRVERVIGEGGMGVVLAVRHGETGGLFAMKLLRRSLAADREARERFLAEARVVARLRSEHAVRVFDVGELPCGTPYLLMEYLEGSDLRSVIERRGRLSVAEASDWMLQTLDALTEAHALGIVHRDLKPENLFVSARADFTTSIKVLDFGISVEAGASGGATPWVGSPHYAAPEELDGRTPPDARSDLWSIGVIFYELLTNELPVRRSRDPLQFPPIRELRPDVPTDLEALLSHCLTPDVEARVATAHRLASSLRRLKERLVSRRRSRPPHPACPVRRARPIERTGIRRPNGRRGFRRAPSLVALPLQVPRAPVTEVTPRQATPTATRPRVRPAVRLTIIVAVCALLLACGAAGFSAARPTTVGVPDPTPGMHFGAL